MTASLINGDDIRYLVSQPESELTTIMGQMTTLMQGITDLQDSTNEKVEVIENQGWFKRMWATVSGKNKATKQEIQRNNDKIVAYISEAVSQLYNMNCINQQIMCSLGNRMNQVYMQVTDIYNEQMNMKSQIHNIMAIQQETLLAMQGFVTKLNEKIESVDNFHMLVTEIEQGVYNDTDKLYSICSVLAQLDKRVMTDNRKLDIIKNALSQSGILSSEEISVGDFLQNIISLPSDKVGMIYLELCNFRESFPANIFAEMIENYHFLPKMEKMSKNKATIINKLLDKYDLDSSAEFSVEDITESFLENKQNSIVEVAQIQQNAVNIENDYQKYWELIENYNRSDEQENEIFEWASKYAKQGYAEAQDMLGFCYYCGLGIEEDEEEGVKWFRKAAEQNYADAQHHLGNCYYFGNGVERNDKEAAKWYRKAAEQGNADAQYDLGDFYYNGTGVEQNYYEAVKWYRKAAEQGVAEAQYDLARCYDYGKGVEKNYEESAKLYIKAAEQNHSKAQYELGRCYKNGWGLNKDYYEAVKWFNESAEQDNDAAQCELGKCYFYGYGVDEDEEEAVKWIKKSVEHENVDAQYMYGVCYFAGIGVEQNFNEAIEWLLKAANKKNKDAIVMMTICYSSMCALGEEDIDMETFIERSEKMLDAIHKVEDDVNDPVALLNLGIYYYGAGMSDEEKKKKAKIFFNKVIKSGGSLATEAQAFLDKM